MHAIDSYVQLLMDLENIAAVQRSGGSRTSFANLRRESANGGRAPNGKLGRPGGDGLFSIPN